MSILLTSDYLQAPIARAVPGSYFDRDKDPKGYYLEEPTPRAATVALKLFPTLANEYPELAALRDSLASDVRPYSNADNGEWEVQAPRVRAQVQKLKHEPGRCIICDAGEQHDFLPHQLADLGYMTAVLQAHDAGYIGWERGLGKTLGACALVETTDAKRVLVVCPNTAKQATWAQELAQFLPDAHVIVLRNSAGQRIKDIGHLKQLHEAYPNETVIFVVHYEVLAIVAGPNGQGWRRLIGEWDLMVSDEAHRLSNPKTKMHKAIMKVPARMRLAMSGSIISNHAEEMYGQLNWLFPDRYRSRWRDWNDRYLDYVDGNFGRICIGIKHDRLEALQEELGVFMVYRRAADSLDLPARTEYTEYVDLTPGQAKVYNALIEDAMAELPDGSLLKADEGLALLGRLRQVASGLSLVTDEPIADSSKLDLAMDIIADNSDDPFVVFSWYKKSAYELAARLATKGIDHYVVTGDVNQNLRAEYIEEFQAGKRRVFIGTIKTLGESVTLTRANQLIMLDRSWNPTDNDQAADRIYRIGQEKPVFITHIVARNTVDEMRVTPIINDKAALRRLILGG
jgi:SNF2 family DNA or RNA helicase